MKKLMTAMLALAFLTATVGVSFAQDTTKKPEDTGKKKTKSKGGKKKESTEKKGGSL